MVEQQRKMFYLRKEKFAKDTKNIAKLQKQLAKTKTNYKLQKQITKTAITSCNERYYGRLAYKSTDT